MTALVLPGACLFWCAIYSAGMDAHAWNITLLGLGVCAAAIITRAEAPPLGAGLSALLALLSVWVLFQLTPLPLGLVRALSPERAALALPDQRFVAISISPMLTFGGWLRLTACIVVFACVRELFWRHSAQGSGWIVMAPLVITAGFEALTGVVHSLSGAADGGAHGTYASRDHFAGLLEVSLPFPLMYGVSALQEGWTRRHTPLRPAVIAGGAFAVAGLLLAGTVYSLSRMGFASAVFGIVVLVATGARRKIWIAAAPVAGLVLLVYLPPNELIARFADVATTERIAAQDRLEIWRDTLPMIYAYRWTGSGLDTYEHGELRFKKSGPMYSDEFAHNDYLQYLAELGIPGFSVGALFVVAVLLSAAGVAFSGKTSTSSRALARASIASICSLLLHSIVDFNTYIPANALALAWVFGAAISTPHLGRIQRDSRMVLVNLPSKAPYLGLFTR